MKIYNKVVFDALPDNYQKIYCLQTSYQYVFSANTYFTKRTTDDNNNIVAFFLILNIQKI